MWSFVATIVAHKFRPLLLIIIFSIIQLLCSGLSKLWSTVGHNDRAILGVQSVHTNFQAVFSCQETVLISQNKCSVGKWKEDHWCSLSPTISVDRHKLKVQSSVAYPKRGWPQTLHSWWPVFKKPIFFLYKSTQDKLKCFSYGQSSFSFISITAIWHCESAAF